MNIEINHTPTDPKEVKQEIDDVFIFNPPFSAEHLASCQKIQAACKALAEVIAEQVPEGKERTIAINGLLSVALYARHGITRRQILIGAVPQDGPPVIADL
jgi:hypothetical protein